MTTGLYSKMAAIMGEVTRVPKTGHNDKQNYDFATEGDVADLIRAKLAAHNVAFFASMLDMEQTPIKSRSGADGYHTIAHLEFTFVCGDTGERMTCQWRGESDDYGDKGVSKAATLGQKYFLLKTFVMSTGDPTDDPDSAGEEASARAQRPTTPLPARAKKQPNGRANRPPEPDPLVQEAADLGGEHWTQDPETVRKFWAFATNERALSKDEIMTALGVEHMSDFTGSKPDAIAALDAFILGKTTDPKAA